MRLTNSRTIGLVVAIAVIILLQQPVPLVSAQHSSQRVQARGVSAIDTALRTSDAQPKEMNRLREGTVLADQPGVFVVNGERISFRMASREELLGVLENLALERISKMLDDAGDRQWSVSGTVTEYRGHNFLLIHRAVLRARGVSGAAAPANSQPGQPSP